MPLTMTTVPLAQVVKNETSLRHREVEALLLPKLQGLRSLPDYARLLKMFRGFYGPLGDRIRQHLPASLLPDVAQRRSSQWIDADLAALNETAVVETCTQLPEIGSAAQAFGALYVLEGSTLGGRVIARMLEKNEGLAIPADALNFFAGYGSETGKMWTAFLEELNKQPDTDAVVQAANQTFSCLKKWMLQTYAYNTAH